MNKTVRQILFWSPRIAGIMFTAFLSIFALDVFGEGYDFLETIIALFMHLLPVFALVIALALAWRWEWIGAATFLGFAAWYVASARGFPWSVYALIAGIPAFVGFLFLIGWIYRKQIKGANKSITV